MKDVSFSCFVALVTVDEQDEQYLRKRYALSVDYQNESELQGTASDNQNGNV